jgi:hypothetical protein
VSPSPDATQDESQWVSLRKYIGNGPDTLICRGAGGS